MSEIKVSERPVVFDPDRMIVRQQAEHPLVGFEVVWTDRWWEDGK